MGVEYERKFKADAQIQQALSARWPGQFHTLEMETTYYDTPDGAFGHMGCVLRCRLENGVGVCTLKTPAQQGFRGEWELVCDDIQAALPKLCKLAELPQWETLSRAPLQRVCGARFIREAALLELADCCVELALDTGVLLGGGRRLCLCEIEVEHKSGERAGADAFADALVAEFGLETQPYSKFARANALAQGGTYGLF